MTWSPTGQNSGGAGNWDLTSSAWYNGTVLLSWNNLLGDSAQFGGVAGALALVSPITVQNLLFTVNGYTLNGGTLTGASSTMGFNAGGGMSATVNSLIANANSGVTRVDINGAGTVVLGGTNTYTGGTTVTNNGTLRVSNDSNLGGAAGALTLGDTTTGGTLAVTAGPFTTTRAVTLGLGGGTVSTGAGVTASMGGVMGGGGAFTVGGTGTVVLNGANTYSGATTISSGTLQIGSGGTTGALGTAASLTNNGTLAFNRSNSYTYAGAISGTGSLQQNGAGTTILSGANTYSGGTTINAGTLQIGAGAATGSIVGNVVNNGLLSFSRNNGYTYAGVVSGTGVLQQNGSGTTTLSGANTYTGETVIRAGLLQVANDGNLGAASSQLHFAGNSNFNASSAFSSARNVVVDSGVNAYAGSSSAAAPLTLNGVVSGAGSFGVYQGQVVLTGANTYTGNTRILGGALGVSSDANLGAAASNVSFVGAGSLRALSSFGTSRNVVLSTAGTVESFNGSTLTLGGIISGGSALTVNSAGAPGGTVVLNGTNTYTGGTLLRGGVRAEVSRDANLGAAAGALDIAAGTLATTASFTSARSMVLNAGGATIDVAPTSTLIASGVISGSGSALQKSNTGTLILTGANTYSAGTTVNAGTLQVGNGGTTGSMGTGNVTNNSALVFNRSNAFAYGGAISGTGSLTLGGAGATTLSGNNSYTGATQVTAGSLYVNGNQTSATGLTTVASGATLGGSGTIGGSVTVANGATLAPGTIGAGGTLNIRGALSLSSGSVLNYDLGQPDTVGGLYNDQVVVGGALTLDGTLNVSATSGGAFGAGVYRLMTYTGALTNNGLAFGTSPAGTSSTLQTSVAGQVNLLTSLANATFWDGPSSPNNSLIEGGAGTWNSGTGANSNWSDAGGIANAPYAAGFAVFQATPGTVTVDNTGGQVVAAGMQFASDGYRITGSPVSLVETTPGSANATLRVGDGTGAGSGYTATVDAALQGTVGVTKTDLGTLVLTGASSYSGGTTVSTGTLQLGAGGTSGSIAGNVTDNGTLVFNRSDAVTFGGVISGTGAVQQIGTGTTLLTGNNTYSGATTVSNGILQVGNGGTTGTGGTGTLTVNTPGTLAFNRSNSVTFGGVISGTGTVAQNGSGTTVFTGDNTYTGGTSINAGTLQLGSGGTTGSIVGNVSNNGALSFNRNATYTYGGVVSGSGSVEQRLGTLTLSGANTYAGGTAFNGGVLQVAGDGNLGAASGSLSFNTGGRLHATSSFSTNRSLALIGNGALSTAAGATLTLAGNISGTGSLLLNAGGTVALLGNNSFSGGLDLGGATVVQANSASSLGTGTISIHDLAVLQTIGSFVLPQNISWAGGPNGGSIDVQSGQTATLTGNQTGTTTFRKTGAGTLVVAANTAYTGPLAVTGGSVQIGAGGTLGTLGGSAAISAGTVLAFNRSDASTYGGVISGAGTVQQNGTGTTSLTAASTYTGGTSVTAGTLQIGNGGAAGSIVGNVTNNSQFAFNRSDVYTYGGVVSGSGALQQNGSGTTVLTGNSTYTGGTTINAGTLQLGNGGTAGTILGDTVNNGTLAFNHSDSETYAGLVSGTGALLQTGGPSSVTTLTRNNSYTGATTVTSGALYVNGNQSAAIGATTVAASAVLGGTGTIGGNVALANDGILAPGSANGTGGTLTINGNLGLNATSILRYSFGALGGVAQNSRTDVYGNLVLDGLIDVTTPVGGTFDPGIYRIFNYSGTLTNNGLALGTVPAATTLALQTGIAGQINLINTTGLLTAVWDGASASQYNNGIADGGAGIWSRNGTNTAWGDASSSVNSVYAPTSFVIFQGTGAAVTVDKSFGDISTSGLQFAVNGYSLSGDEINLVETASGTGSTNIRVGDGSPASAAYTASIGSVLQGSTKVTKNGLGTLVLTGTNLYSGGTQIDAGTVRISSDANLGAAAGALGFDGGVLETTASMVTARATTLNTNGATVDVDAGQTLTMNGAISGVGKLTKTDTGTLVLSGANTYSGGTSVNGGRVKVSSDSNLGAAAGALSIDGGTLETTASMSSVRAVTLNTGGATLDVANGTTLALTNTVDGTGALTKTSAGTLVLSGANSYSGGTVINGGKLSIGSDANLGAAAGALSFGGGALEATASFTSARAITLNASGGTLDVDVGSTLTLTSSIAGTGALNKTDAGTLVLSSANTYSGGTTISGGVLKITHVDGVGSGTVNIGATASLELATVAPATFDNLLAGTGTTTVSGAQTSITGANAAYAGQWNLTGSGRLVVTNTSTSSNQNLGTGAVNIGATASVDAQTTGAFTFNNALSGAGTLNASNANQAFSFGAGAGNAFTGTLNLSNNSFDLSGPATSVLTNATLALGTGNVTTVGNGHQVIGGLSLDGATLGFNASALDQTVAISHITTGTLDISRAGTVRIDLPVSYVISPPSTPNTNNLLMQDEGDAGMQLIAAGTVAGYGSNLALTDLSGNVITAATQVGLIQNGSVVAQGLYDYRLSAGAAADGLYVRYGLNQLALLAGQTLTLAQDNGATNASADMSAKITGSGNLAIAAGAGTVSLSNAGNDYSGETSVASGTLRVDANNALGQTSKLSLANATGFDLNGKTQSIGALNGAAGSTLDLHGGTLTLSNGGTSAGALTGAGQLNFTGGALAVPGSNPGLTASTAITSGATVRLNRVDGLGSGAISHSGALVFDGATGVMANTITGAGTVQLTNAADISFTGSNALSSSWDTAVGTRLSVATAANLGTGAIHNAGTFNVDTASDWTLTNALSGAGAISKNGTGTLTVTQANTSATGATTISGGLLQLTDIAGVGSGAVRINTTLGSTTTGLALVLGSASTFSNTLTGTGTTTVSGAQVAVTGANAAYTGQWRLAGPGALVMASTSTSSNQNLGTGGVDIGATASVNVQTTGAFSFNNALSGGGTLNAANANQAFSFGAGAGNAFTGTLNLSNNSFDLSGPATSVLTNATLALGAGNVTTVGNGHQVIGGLILDGATLGFNASALDQTVAISHITAGALDVSQASTVRIDLPVSYVISPPSTPNTNNLLMQDEGDAGMQLIRASTVNGSAGNIMLSDRNGNAITASMQTGIAQGGNTVALGTYNYRLTSGIASDGLYVSYGLNRIELLVGQTLTLAQDSGATNAAADMSARITGIGSLAIAAGAGTVSLSNTSNDYSGETRVDSGTLRAEANTALGQTSKLSLANTTGFDLNGKSQSIGALNGAAGSTLDLHGGTLTVSSGGTSAGTLTGAGQLNFTGGSLAVQGANPGLTASTSITNGATVSLNHVEGLGSRAIRLNGTLLLDGATGLMANAIEGTGEVIKQGNGTVTMTGRTAWTGTTQLAGGVLVLDGSAGGGRLVSNIVGTSGTSLSLQNGAMLTGWIDPTNVNIDARSNWNMTASSLVDTVALAGTIQFAAPALLPLSLGRTLTASNWVGQGGTVTLFSVLGSDNSPSDKIVIDGGRASGNTGLVIKHGGGVGAQTNKGIRLVETLNGGTTDAGAFNLSAASDGYRAGTGTIAAGAYDYSLKRGGNGGVANDWYLVSACASCAPEAPTETNYRPEVGAYLNNRLFAQTMQMHTLHERRGEALGTQTQNTSSDVIGWARVEGKSSSRDSVVSLSDRTYLFHAGIDLARLKRGDGSIRLGVMGAYGLSENHADNGTLGSRGTVRGYNLGLYGTWYGNQDISTGPYVDAWLMAGVFNNEVSGQGLTTERYKSRNLAASLEVGHSVPLLSTGNTLVYLEPQGQLILSNYRADTHTERTGTVVSTNANTRATTRVGLRLHTVAKNVEGKKLLCSFVELNWWLGPSSQSVNFDADTVRDTLPRSRLEAKVGLEGQVSRAVSMWGSVGYETGARQYSAGKAQVGVKYSW
ncbi:autotransporter-associated beta strand repeat-containing protein [Variovorax sp. HJSM1_2]|uniref:autotransporter-associated beta strand repeat-containing protein n=1 Tax=Variovorax sp. HJSM1_2 TaxID=3366263 RepID=UPI003BE6FDC7